MKDRNTISLADILRSFGGWRLKLVKLFDHLAGTAIALILPARPHLEENPNAVKRILVIRPGGIGDAVFLLPIFRELRALGFSVDVLCEKRNKEVFQSQRGVCDEIFCYDNVNQFLKVFRKSYDAVIDTEQWHLFSAIAAYFIKTGARIGFATRPLRQKLFEFPVEYGLDTYELENFETLFSIFGIQKKLTLRGSFEVFQEDLDWAGRELPFSYAVVSLAGSVALRRFTKEQLACIADQVHLKGLKVVFVGGKDVVGLAPQGAGLVDLTGQLSLAMTAAVIKNACFFIGHDSGVLHIACATQACVFAIFGPGNDRKWFLPGNGSKLLLNPVYCRPCTRFGYILPTCQGQFSCLNIKDKLRRQSFEQTS